MRVVGHAAGKPALSGCPFRSGCCTQVCPAASCPVSTCPPLLLLSRQDRLPPPCRPNGTAGPSGALRTAVQSLANKVAGRQGIPTTFGFVVGRTAFQVGGI